MDSSTSFWLNKPLSWRTYWIQRSGEKVPATSQCQLELVCHECFHTASGEDLQEKIQPHERKVADEQSWSATSRLFNWHRHNEDGLWLDDGTRDVEAIRQLQRHPWIVDPFDDGGQFDLLDEDKRPELRRENILEWSAEVEKYRQLWETVNL
ncbi:hypothetical protein VTN00DRAFT_5201 [Thermoascus crustaceus]|uniref:uncharacterized protein n=1 Tax=Thermoascus crustaceus TaxID=5088 RepID=UPI003743DDE7